ncbi:MAG: hydroxymethylglutaryl-CoA lyase [Rhodothermales bacterium]
MKDQNHGEPMLIDLCDVGPRDGFQFEVVPIPTQLKLDTIRDLMSSGIRRIQATSFVHPGRVPQMADAEALLGEFLPEATAAGATLSALALNMRGVERAAAAGVLCLDLSIALNETHARDNANSTVREGIRDVEAMIRTAQSEGMQVQLGLQTVWGYNAPDDTPEALILEVVQHFRGAGLESLSLADSTGMAAPPSIRRMLDNVRSADPATPIVLHLHDTRGLGLANIACALDWGVRRFDTSFGGLGGCPFIPGATGNVATEDVSYLANRLGYRTDIDVAKVAALSRRIEAHVGHPLSGRNYKLLSPLSSGPGRPR